MSKVLEAGDYVLEEGMTIERTGRFVTVRPVIKGIADPRCRDCMHFGEGHATRNGWTTTVCKLQPKGVTDSEGYKLYYHVGSRQMPCGKYEKKGDNNDQ